MKRILKKYLIWIVFIVAMGNLVAFFIDPTFISRPSIWLRNSLFSIFVGVPMMMLNEFIIVHIGRRVKWESSPLKRLFLSLFIMIVLATLITILLNYFYCYWIYHSSFADCVATTLNMLLIEILIIVYVFTFVTGIDFFRMWREGLIKQESLQRKALELQLEALKNQVNPHFLFNSLNTLATLIHKDPDMAVNLIMQLSDSFRYLLEQKDKKVVEWRVEKQFVENYMSLQVMRFSGNIHMQIEISANQDFYVVPLSVQMLVENAIKHNVITSDEPLQIFLYIENNFLVVRNNLKVKSTLVSSGNVGLENIRLQYEILTGRKVEVYKEDGFFTVKLPMIEKPFSDA
jgi:two-component system, LytTR family, sensor kinase